VLHEAPEELLGFRDSDLCRGALPTGGLEKVKAVGANVKPLSFKTGKVILLARSNLPEPGEFFS
jgi:hypothetical protein